jgi:hypothetical protein
MPRKSVFFQAITDATIRLVRRPLTLVATSRPQSMSQCLGEVGNRVNGETLV